MHPEDVTSSTRLSGEVVDGLPNNGRNYLDFALLTPGVAISQGPDGDELNISGQRGIFNNFIVDGADFNNPFFGEQRGGQRPAFTFSQDAIEEVVVVNQGATAEFGRSAGGFVNVITKSGTNELEGSAHYFGQWDGVSAAYPVAVQAGKPDFFRNQFGFTLGGPIVRDRSFFFVAYDQQVGSETKQAHRLVENPANLARLRDFLNAQWPGLFDGEFGPITRTDDARALLVKSDVHLDGRNQLSFKYNYSWSEQLNGTFDVDSWGLSANGVETDEAHAFNASWRSLLSSTLSHELRVQWAREDRVRWYDGPLMPDATPPATPQFRTLGGRPFPDIGMDFADAFRIGLPFFLPIDPAFDTRLQIVDNWSWLTGQPPVQGGRRVQPDGDLAAVHWLRERALRLRFGRRVHQLRDAGERVCHMLGRVGQRGGDMSRWDEHHRPRAPLPPVGDRTGRRAGPAGQGRLPRGRAGLLRTGHLEAQRAADGEPGSALGGDLAPCGDPSNRTTPSTPPTSPTRALPPPTARSPTTLTTSSRASAWRGT